MGRLLIGTTNISLKNTIFYNNTSFTNNYNLQYGVQTWIYPNRTPPNSMSYDRNASGYYHYINLGNSLNGASRWTLPFSTSFSTVARACPYIVSSVIYGSITIEASANYGYTFRNWRTAANGGGALISSNNPWTITHATGASYSTLYPYFS